MRKVILLLLLWIVPFATELHAQRARLMVPADSVAIGERFPVVVLVVHEPTWQVKTPEVIPDSTRWGMAEIRALRQHAVWEEQGMVRDSLVFEAVTFALDSARIGPVSLTLYSDTDTLEVRAQSVVLPVRSVVPADAQDIRDLAPLAEFPYPWWVYVFWVGVLGIILVLMWYIWQRWHRRLQAKETIEEVVLEEPSPFERAIERLEALGNQLPLEEEAVKAYYVELADILREYLGGTYGLPAKEQTSRELLWLLERLAHQGKITFPSDIRLSLAAHFGFLDLVKFAGFRPESARHAELLQEIKVLIETIESLQHSARSAHKFSHDVSSSTRS